MARTLLGAFLSLLAAGCHQPLWTPRPLPAKLPAEDWRQKYVGRWRVEFALDSLRGAPSADSGAWVWRAAVDTSARALGHLTVRDSLLDRDGQTLASTLSIDFAPLLGRPVSCLSPNAAGVGITQVKANVLLWFTPGAFDCGLVAQAEPTDGELRGTWEEPSIAGPVASGHFSMHRE